jgi:hypothetical protein
VRSRPAPLPRYGTRSVRHVARGGALPSRAGVRHDPGDREGGDRQADPCRVGRSAASDYDPPHPQLKEVTREGVPDPPRRHSDRLLQAVRKLRTGCPETIGLGVRNQRNTHRIRRSAIRGTSRGTRVPAHPRRPVPLPTRGCRDSEWCGSCRGASASQTRRARGLPDATAGGSSDTPPGRSRHTVATDGLLGATGSERSDTPPGRWRDSVAIGLP